LLAEKGESNDGNQVFGTQQKVEDAVIDWAKANGGQMGFNAKGREVT
jgi:hypothetical protein